MPAQRKYPKELRERAVNMVLEIRIWRTVNGLLSRAIDRGREG